MANKCPLCPPNLASSEHDLLWHALQETGYTGVTETALQFGIDIDERKSRAHFQYHRPRQAAPVKRWRQERALEAASELTERQRSLLDLCFRLPALGANEIGRALYWNGDPAKLVSAEKAALRDLRYLIGKDMIFRCYLENLTGAGARPEEISGLYFLGANGRAYVERLHQCSASKGEWVSDDADLGTWVDVYAKHRAHLAVSSLQQQMPGMTKTNGRYVEVSATTAIRWDTRNWLDGQLIRCRFKDPLNEATRFRPTGIAALSISQGEESFLAPFAYYHDDAARRLDLLLDDICAHRALARSGEMAKILPDIAAHLPLPALVIASDLKRVKRLLEAARTRGAANYGAPPPAFVSDEKAVASAGLQGEVWTPLFADADKQLILPAMLLRLYGKHPIKAQRLRWRHG